MRRLSSTPLPRGSSMNRAMCCQALAGEGKATEGLSVLHLLGLGPNDSTAPLEKQQHRSGGGWLLAILRHLSHRADLPCHRRRAAARHSAASAAPRSRAQISEIQHRSRGVFLCRVASGNFVTGCLTSDVTGGLLPPVSSRASSKPQRGRVVGRRRRQTAPGSADPLRLPHPQARSGSPPRSSAQPRQHGSSACASSTRSAPSATGVSSPIGSLDRSGSLVLGNSD